MDAKENIESELIIAQNKEEWDRLLFLLSDPDPNVLWINCDTARLKRPLHDALTTHFQQLKPYDIYIDEKTESLNRIILWEDKDKIPIDSIIHVFGMEEAVKSMEFLSNLNFQRDSTFRKTPCHIIFWADFDTGTILSRKTYDFWSWIVFTFDFVTPAQLLTARQKGFREQLILEDTTIPLPHKDSIARIRHLEDEWEEFLKSVNGKPSTIKQMKDAVTIARALANEYGDEGKFSEVADIMLKALDLNRKLLDKYDNAAILSELTVAFENLKDLSKAREFGEKALKEARAIYGNNYFEISACESNLALVYQDLGELNLAKELLEAALRRNINLFGIDSRMTAVTEVNLADVYREMGDLNEAQRLLERAVDSYSRENNSYELEYATALSNLSIIYRDLGNLKKSKDFVEKAISIDERNYGEWHPNTGIKYANLARVCADLGDDVLAYKYIYQAFDIFKISFGEDHPNTIRVRNFLKQLEQNEPR